MPADELTLGRALAAENIMIVLNGSVPNLTGNLKSAKSTAPGHLRKDLKPEFVPLGILMPNAIRTKADISRLAHEAGCSFLL